MTNRGFLGRPPSKEVAERLPPGQYKTGDFPVLAMGPTPHVGLGRTSALQARFQLLLVQLTRYRPVKRPVCGLTQAEVLVRDFRSLVERHFRERLTVQHYAARLRVSEGHLCRIVRKQTGMTASDLMQERVVVEANRLLARLEANI